MMHGQKNIKFSSCNKRPQRNSTWLSDNNIGQQPFIPPALKLFLRRWNTSDTGHQGLQNGKFADTSVSNETKPCGVSRGPYRKGCFHIPKVV